MTRRLLVVLVLAALAGCGPEADPVEDELIGASQSRLAVSTATGCDTGIVSGLTHQLIEELTCAAPTALTDFASAKVNLYSSVNPYLAPGAATALKNAATAAGGVVTVSSAYRSLAQQYLLYKWWKAGQCGIQIAAAPGNSNHQSGRAVDIPSYGYWKPYLSAKGWSWYGSGDVVHFDFLSAQNIASKSIVAFQHLWNRNHTTKLAEDGTWGAATQSAMAFAPSTGFAIHGCATSGKVAGLIYQNGSTGNPVGGATVTVAGSSVTTGADGKFAFTLAPGAYTVSASAPGFSPASVARTVTAGVTVDGSMQLHAVVSTGTLKGRVTDAAGMAVLGATATAGGVSKSTDSTGAFSLSLPAGNYTLLVSKVGLQTVSKSVSVGAGAVTTTNVLLSAADGSQAPVISLESPGEGDGSQSARVTFTGSATDDLDALSSVEVMVNGMAAQSFGVAAGRFEANVKLQPGANTVELSAIDSGGRIGRAVWHGAFRSGVSGVVRLYDTPEATIANADVTLVAIESQTTVASAVTDASGHFDLETTEVPGNFEVRVKADGYVSAAQSLVIDAEERQTLDLGLTPGNDADAPSIRFIEPRAGEAVVEPEVNVSGVVSGLDVSEVTVDGVAASLLGQSAFVARLPMPEGRHTFQVVASNADGREITATIEAQRPMTPAQGGCSAAPGGALGLIGVLSLVLRRGRGSPREVSALERHGP